jgi:hypothetical protein
MGTALFKSAGIDVKVFLNTRGTGSATIVKMSNIQGARGAKNKSTMSANVTPVNLATSCINYMKRLHMFQMELSPR